ncbi:MAG: hypothetical protein OCD02_10300 [Spirochaetaceae bacterium]
MKKLFLISLLLIFTTLYSNNSDQEKYQKLLQSNKMDELFTHLQEWDKNSEKDVELYIAYFNYYLRLGQSSKTIIGPLGEGGYGLYEKQFYDKKPTEVALHYLDEALVFAPNRLDIHFGKSNILAQTYQYEKLRDSILIYLNYSKDIKSDWLWANNNSFKKHGWNVEDAMISSTTDYINYMFEYFDNSKIYIKDIVEAYLDIYPQNITGLNVAARYYDLNDDITTKIMLLEKAYKIDPSDYIIIGNLAYTFENIKDYDNARFYYNLMSEIDNESSKKYATDGLKRIENK